MANAGIRKDDLMSRTKWRMMVQAKGQGRVRREKKGLTFSFTNIGLDYYSTTLSCTY